jgi:replication factor A1
MVNMEISELNVNSTKVNIKAKVIEKDSSREILTRYGKTKVSNAKLEDKSGTIKLVLWGDDADKINEGDTIEIENGFVKEWNSELQLSVGKFGKLTVL